MTTILSLTSCYKFHSHNKILMSWYTKTNFGWKLHFNWGALAQATQARSKRCSIDVPNLTVEFSTAEEWRLKQFDSAGQVWCGKQHQIRQGLPHYATLERQLIHTAYSSRVEPNAWITVMHFSNAFFNFSFFLFFFFFSNAFFNFSQNWVTWPVMHKARSPR